MVVAVFASPIALEREYYQYLDVQEQASSFVMPKWWLVINHTSKYLLRMYGNGVSS